MTKGTKVNLINSTDPAKVFIVSTANYLLAEKAARSALEKQGINPDDYPSSVMAGVEIIDPID